MQLPSASSLTTVSPRKNSKNPRDNGPISGTDLISLNRDTSLRFTFPQTAVQTALPATLTVKHANAIKWSYTLNTNVISTYAGEVIQVLSAFVGPITINGQSQDYYDSNGNFISANDELRRVYDWFRAYMTIAAGAGKSVSRNETAIYFTYPERGWSFYIQPTALNGFAYGTERLGTEWSIQAEIVMDNDLNYFEAATMAQFTDVPMTAVFDDPTFTGSLFQGAGDPRIDPLAAPNTGLTTSKINDFGNNFQDLVAAWTSGDFAHWGFDANISPSDNALQDAAGVYQNLFGSQNLVGTSDPAQTGTTGSGSITYGGPTNPTNQTDIAEDIFTQFAAQGIPGRLAIAVSLQESGMNPNRTQDSCSIAACGIGLFQVNGDGSGGDQSAQVKAAGAQREYSSTSGNITSAYPVDAQIKGALAYFLAQKNSSQPGTKTGTVWAGVDLTTASDEKLAQFAWDVQRAGDTSYIQHIEAQLKSADALIKKFQTGGTASQYRQNVVGWVTKLQGMISYSEDGTRWNWKNQSIGGNLAGANYATDCSGFVTLCYAWGTNFDPKYDPSGIQYGAGNTASMLPKGQTVEAEQAQAGDLVIFVGPSQPGGHHVAILIEDYNGPNTMLESQGGPGVGPHQVTLAAETQAQAAYGAPTPVFKSYLP